MPPTLASPYYTTVGGIHKVSEDAKIVWSHNGEEIDNMKRRLKFFESQEHPQLYLSLFHGRKTVDENMNDWGEQGPIFGPLRYTHSTYDTDIKCETLNGNEFQLVIVEDCVYYDGMYYGDWSACVIEKSAINQTHIVVFDPQKGKPNANL